MGKGTGSQQLTVALRFANAQRAAAQGTSLLPQRFCLAGYTVGERGEVDRKEYP